MALVPSESKIGNLHRQQDADEQHAFDYLKFIDDRAKRKSLAGGDSPQHSIRGSETIAPRQPDTPAAEIDPSEECQDIHHGHFCSARNEARQPQRRHHAPPNGADGALQNQVQPVQESPKNKGQIGTVPQPAEQHGEHVIFVGAEFALAVSAERDVEVIAQPRRKRDMPARPEFTETPGEIRRSEVLREMVAHHPSQPDGDVRIPRKVAVNLERVENHPDEQVHGAKGFGRVKTLIHKGRERIGDGYFFEKAPQHTAKAGMPGPPLEAFVIAHLRQQIPRPHDGAGDELREQRDERREAQQRRLPLDFAAVHVNRVRHGLECVERNADGQDDVQGRPRGGHSHARDHVGEAFGEEVEVFEKAKKAQVHCHAEHQHGFAGKPPRTCEKRQSPEEPRCPTATLPSVSCRLWLVQVGKPHSKPAVHCRGKDNERKEADIPPAVEKVTRQQANPQPCPPPCAEVQREKQGDENQEGEGVENHFYGTMNEEG